MTAAVVRVLPPEIIRAADKGWRLHPLTPRKKVPLLKSWQVKATANTEELASWAGKYEGCNWGVATGPQSGFFVLDLDGDTGLDWLKARIDDGNELPETWSVHTARGLHLYFRWEMEVRNSTSKLAAGVDIRGAGGYVVAPPSVHPDGPEYRAADTSCPVSPAPAWLLALLQDQSVIVKAKTPMRFDVLAPGQRNDGLTRFAGYLRRKGSTQSEIESELQQANARRCFPPLLESEVSAIAASVSRYPTGGPDPLETAWQAVRAAGTTSGYDGFIALAMRLQEARPGLAIALPLKRTAALFGVHFTSVQQWRKRAVATGLLAPAGDYIPHRKAGLYRAPLSDSNYKKATTTITTGLVIGPEFP
jgi:hypothetical protein